MVRYETSRSGPADFFARASHPLIEKQPDAARMGYLGGAFAIPLPEPLPNRLSVALVTRLRLAGAGLAINRLQVHHPHPPPHPLLVDHKPFPPQHRRQARTTIHRMRQMQLVEACPWTGASTALTGREGQVQLRRPQLTPKRKGNHSTML